MTKARDLANGRASALQSATTTVDVSASPAPIAGRVLTATSPTTATWQPPSTSSGTNLDGGGANTNYGGITAINAGGA